MPIQITENYKDLLEQVKKTQMSALTIEKAEAMIADLMKSINGLDPIVRKSRNETDDYFDHEKPGSLVELHKSSAWDKNPTIKKAQQKMDDCYLLSILMKRDPRQFNLWQETMDFIQKSELGKAMDTATATSGANWVPTQVSDYLVELVERKFRLAQENLFPRITMTRSPMEFYRINGFATAFKGVENTNITASNPNTGKSTLTAEELCVYIPFSYTLEEDSIIALLPQLKKDVVNALYRGTEDAIGNGDVTGTHMDSDVVSATDARKLWKGLRKTALAGSSRTVDLATFNLQTILRVMQKLGDYAEPEECFWTVGPKLAIKLLNLKDESGNALVVTMDKVADKASILTGQVAILAGSPVITSPKNRENLNAAGVYDGTTVDKTVMLYTRKEAFAIGSRRDITVETDKDIVARTTKLVATERLIFEDRIVDTQPTVAMGYNIDPNA